MKLSTRTLYSFRLLIYLADHADRKEPIKLKEVAEKQGLPFKYLEQLIVSLRNAGLVKSVQGKQGGYVLAREPGEITALDVVEASSGPVEFMRCGGRIDDCDFKQMCTATKMWGLIETRVNDVLSEYTLEDMSERRMLEKLAEQGGDEQSQIRCFD